MLEWQVSHPSSSLSVLLPLPPSFPSLGIEHRGSRMQSEYCTTKLHLYHGFQFTAFVGFLSEWLTERMRGSQFPVPSLGLFSFSLLTLPKSDVLVFVLIYLTLLFSLRRLFSSERQKGCASRWEGKWKKLGKIERGETAIRTYYPRKCFIFR